jgi:hypothetical protein
LLHHQPSSWSLLPRDRPSADQQGHRHSTQRPLSAVRTPAVRQEPGVSAPTPGSGVGRPGVGGGAGWGATQSRAGPGPQAAPLRGRRLTRPPAGRRCLPAPTARTGPSQEWLWIDGSADDPFRAEQRLDVAVKCCGHINSAAASKLPEGALCTPGLSSTAVRRPRSLPVRSRSRHDPRRPRGPGGGRAGRAEVLSGQAVQLGTAGALPTQLFGVLAVIVVEVGMVMVPPSR